VMQVLPFVNVLSFIRSYSSAIAYLLEHLLSHVVQ
jgi:hypothetical protein